MFDSPLKFSCISRTKEKGKALRSKRLYKFTSPKKKVYHVVIDEFPHKVFVVKYYLKIDEARNDKFNRIINDGHANRIIGTVVAITLSIWKEDQFASFAYIGIFKINSESYRHRRESKDTIGTQRFSIYKRITENLFGGNAFLHSVSEQMNAYMLISRQHSQPAKVLTEVIDEFRNVFPDVMQLLE